jgi:plasmid stabilization system protein ParE
MGWKIIFAPQALADLPVLVRYIAKDNPEAALRVGNELIDRVAVLENVPFLGAPYPKSTGVRRLVSSPYIIFYRPKADQQCIEILRYWDGRQKEPGL